MTDKIVYQTNRQGIYIGVTTADPCPLEEGVWLIPGGCVEVEPPLVYKLPSAVKVSSALSFTNGNAFVKALQAST